MTLKVVPGKKKTKKGQALTLVPMTPSLRGMNLAKRVKQIIKGTEETKYVAETIIDGRAANYVNFNSTIKTGLDWYRCIPQLPQGSSGSADVTWVRDGSDVSTIQNRVNWEFRFSNTDTHTRDIFVVLYIVQPIAQKSYGSNAVNGTMNFPGQFLKTGSVSGTYSNQKEYSGNYIDTTMPIYDKAFRLLYKKIFRLSRSSGSANGDGVLGAGSGTGQYANMGPISKRLSWTNKHIPKVLKYSETAAVAYPQNTAPYWACGYYYADGTAADTAGGLLNVSCYVDLTFKDT